MASSSQAYTLELSTIRSKTLKSLRRFLEENDQAVAGVDADIANAFDPNFADVIELRLLTVQELFSIREQMQALGLGEVDVLSAISSVFGWGGSEGVGGYIARWKELKCTRDQMKNYHIDTSDIDRNLFDIFGPPTIPQHYLPLTPPPFPIPLTGFNAPSCSSSQGASSATSQQISVQIRPTFEVEKKPKPSFWSEGQYSGWKIPFVSVKMAGLSYKPGRSHQVQLFFSPDFDTKTLIIRQKTLPDSDYISVTRRHPALQWAPGAAVQVMRAGNGNRVRFVLLEEDNVKQFVDISFASPGDIYQLLGKMREIKDVPLEDVEKECMEKLLEKHRARSVPMVKKT